MCLGELTYLKGFWENVEYSVKESPFPSIVLNRNSYFKQRKHVYEYNRVPYF